MTDLYDLEENYLSGINTPKLVISIDPRKELITTIM